MDTKTLEALVRQVLLEKLGETGRGAHGVRVAAAGEVRMTEADRLDTGGKADKVYTRDLFSLSESPRLGAGVMEMTDAVFPWHLDYDEMDYVLEGRLTVLVGEEAVSAGPGEVLLIPKGSDIRFSAQGHARFLYFVYPADWQKKEN